MRGPICLIRRVSTCKSSDPSLTQLGNKKNKTEEKKDQKKSKHLTAKLQHRIKDRVIDPKVLL